MIDPNNPTVQKVRILIVVGIVILLGVNAIESEKKKAYYAAKQEYAKQENQESKLESVKEQTTSQISLENATSIITNDITDAFHEITNTKPFTYIDSGVELDILGISEDHKWVKTKVNGIFVWLKVYDIKLK